jgi:hypothetical protein
MATAAIPNAVMPPTQDMADEQAPKRGPPLAQLREAFPRKRAHMRLTAPARGSGVK